MCGDVCPARLSLASRSVRPNPATVKAAVHCRAEDSPYESRAFSTVERCGEGRVTRSSRGVCIFGRLAEPPINGDPGIPDTFGSYSWKWLPLSDCIGRRFVFFDVERQLFGPEQLEIGRECSVRSRPAACADRCRGILAVLSPQEWRTCRNST